LEQKIETLKLAGNLILLQVALFSLEDSSGVVDISTQRAVRKVLYENRKPMLLHNVNILVASLCGISKIHTKTFFFKLKI